MGRKGGPLFFEAKQQHTFTHVSSQLQCVRSAAVNAMCQSAATSETNEVYHVALTTTCMHACGLHACGLHACAPMQWARTVHTGTRTHTYAAPASYTHRRAPHISAVCARFTGGAGCSALAAHAARWAAAALGHGRAAVLAGRASSALLCDVIIHPSGFAGLHSTMQGGGVSAGGGAAKTQSQCLSVNQWQQLRNALWLSSDSL